MCSSSEDQDCTGRRVVIDLGSSLIKVGFAGQHEPMLVPNVIGFQKESSELVMVGIGSRDYYCGREAFEKKGILNFQYPVQRGVVQNWDYLEKILHYIYENQLGIAPSTSAVLITEPPLNPKSNSERLCQLLFETFNVPAMLLATDSTLTMVGNGGMQTGIVVSSGEGVTSVTPIYEGYVIERGIRRLHLGGGDVTNYLSRLFLDSGHSFKTCAELEILNKLKESLAYVVQDFNQQMVNFITQWDSNVEKYYTLPDGRVVTVSTERFECSECLFQPSHLGREHKGIQSLIHSSIQACDVDIRRDLCRNILLNGGNTMFPGMPERMHQEMVNLSPPKSVFKIISPPRRNTLTWTGGSIIASLSHFSHWIERFQYDDMGPTCVHGKKF